MASTAQAGRIEQLRRIPLFSGLDDAALQRVLAVTASDEQVQAGHVLTQEGQPASGMFIIEEGTVVVERPSGAVELGPGEFFGELGLLFDDAVRSLRVSAKTPVRFLALSRDDATRLIETEPQIALVMLRTLARRLWAATRT